MGQIVFKITASGSVPGKERVGESNFKDHYPAINTSMAWATLKPFVRQAQNKYLLPYLCEDLLEDIATQFNDGDNLTPAVAEFLTLLQDATAYYTISHALPTLNGLISDMGVTQSSATEGTSAPVEMWRYKNLRWEVTNTADDMLDQLLEYLDRMILERVTYFDIWKDSPCYQSVASCFFRSPAHFEGCHFGTEKRRTFTTLLPYIRKAEGKMMSILCLDLFEELKAQVAEPDTLTVNNATLLSYVRPLVVEIALLDAIPKLRLNIEADGIKIVSNTDGMNMKRDAYDSAVAMLQQKVEENVKAYTQDLWKYLYDNADNFPLWKNSTCHKDDSCKIGGKIKISPDRIGGVML